MSTRRDFLKTSGFLVVGLSVSGIAGELPLEAQGALGPGPYPDVDFRQLDSWIVIRQDNTATFYVGKTDLGQGTGTAFRQVMSDELDFPYDKTTCVMGSTDVTVDQGGSGGSDALQTDGYPMRRVAAEARRVLLDMASSRFGVPVSALVVSDGMISVGADPSKKATYGELIGGRKFNVTLTGNNINATTGVAKLKDVREMKMVGKSPQRYDIPAKVDGSLKWAVDAKVPGMLHARNVKPPFAGAKLVSIDESSVNKMPGFVKVVSKGNYVAVVFQREEQAINGARALKANWQKPATAPFPTSENLFSYMRQAMPTMSNPPSVVGNTDAAIKGATKIVEAEYEIPFQGHVSIGPAHADIADRCLAQRAQLELQAIRGRERHTANARVHIRPVGDERVRGPGIALQPDESSGRTLAGMADVVRDIRVAIVPLTRYVHRSSVVAEEMTAQLAARLLLKSDACRVLDRQQSNRILDDLCDGDAIAADVRRQIGLRPQRNRECEQQQGCGDAYLHEMHVRRYRKR